MAGYLDEGGGRYDTLYAGVNGAAAPTAKPTAVLTIANGLALIAAYFQESP
ncbi:hypothetical protein [Streptomyces sp. NBC_00503]|uniref:hypothetical protein n=1 Tax=Streptomyces sp. NBC_00503 TaxID=2903659 RepID=UPI002E8130A7|nr:hypothetical protein [Streptomyces sp. NBC_00503]WUD86288.1 hypothetical protein OG490_00605 [Streptomyces sp. NBC_00503]